MANMKILIVGDPKLRQKAKPVTRFDESLETLAGDMIATMIEADGVGLAATQVGVMLRFFVVGLPVEDDEDARKIITVANPEIVEQSEEEVAIEEGCLSIPGITEDVERPEWIVVRFQDIYGKTHEMKIDGLFARVFQHEKDHLDGVLFIDHLSTLKRTMLKPRIKKLQEERSGKANVA